MSSERGVLMGAYEAIKDAVSMIQKTDNIELYRTILDVQKECLDLLEENRILKEQVRLLQDNKDIQERLLVKGHCYYMPKENGSLDGPFCTTCWDKDRKLIRMHVSDSGGFDLATCHVCDFGTSYVD